MVSNEVASLRLGASCEALLLTPKSRIIAVLVVFRRGEDDFLLVTEPALDEAVTAALLRARFAAKVAVEAEQHPSYVWLGASPPVSDTAWSFPTDAYGVSAIEVVGDSPPVEATALSRAEAELLRIEAGTPLMGREIDDRILPAEAGLVERSVSFAKGCYPGQEPIARLHHRGHANRELRVLVIDTPDPPDHEAEVELDDRVVGRITSAISRGDDTVALAYVRVEVRPSAALVVNDASATLTDRRRP